MHTSSKRFGPYSFAHRQAKHPGHCKLVHGYARYFTLHFCADELDPETRFVFDFGQGQPIRNFLTQFFDHKLLINQDDPEMSFFDEGEQKGLWSLVKVSSVATEELCAIVMQNVNGMLIQMFASEERLVGCYKVVIEEHEFNAASYELEIQSVLSSMRSSRKEYIRMMRQKAIDEAKAKETEGSHDTQETSSSETESPSVAEAVQADETLSADAGPDPSVVTESPAVIGPSV